MPRLVASAIKFYPIDSEEYPVVVCGKRHCNCFELMYNHQLNYNKQTHVQGFLTDENRFVDRYEAAEIAWYANQVLKESDTYQKMWEDYVKNGELTRAYQLFSEDLW